jgi:hypothetical protein
MRLHFLFSFFQLKTDELEWDEKEKKMKDKTKKCRMLAPRELEFYTRKLMSRSNYLQTAAAEVDLDHTSTFEDASLLSSLENAPNIVRPLGCFSNRRCGFWSTACSTATQRY